MKYHEETAVEIEKEIEKFNSGKGVDHFVILCLHYHHVQSEKNPYSYCEFIAECKHFF